MNKSNALIEFRRPTQALLDEAKPLVERDRGILMRATDIVIKEGKVIGYVSIGDIPSVHMWFDAEKAQPRDYLTTMSYFEGVLARSGVTAFWMPCESTSKLLPFVERLGYTKTNYENNFIKTLLTK